MFGNKKIKEQAREIDALREEVAQLSVFVTNLVHEVEILKEALFHKGTLSPKQWEESFQELKKKSLWNKRGWGSQSEHWRRYSRSIEEWSRQLFPNLSDKKREEVIRKYQNGHS